MTHTNQLSLAGIHMNCGRTPELMGEGQLKREQPLVLTIKNPSPLRVIVTVQSGRQEIKKLSLL